MEVLDAYFSDITPLIDTAEIERRIIELSRIEGPALLKQYKPKVESCLTYGNVADALIFLQIKQQEMSSIAEIVSPDRKADFLDQVRTFTASVKRTLKHQNVLVPVGTEQETQKSKRLFPKAILGGPAVNECFTEEQLEDIGRPKWNNVHLILKSWADGNRSIYDITRLAIFETGKDLSLAYALTFFEHYAEQGIVSL